MLKNIILEVKTCTSLLNLTIACLVTILTFPVLEFQTFSGLDPAYFYALNYFFKKGFVAGDDYIFTYGPLGFLKDPQALCELDWFGSIILFLLRFLCVWSVIVRIRNEFDNLIPWWIVVAMVFAFARLQSIDYVIFIFSVFSLNNFLYKPTPLNLLLALIPVNVGLFIKLNIGFTSLVTVFSILLIYYIKTKNTYLVLRFILYYIISNIFLWLIISKDIFSWFKYYFNNIILSSDNLRVTTLPSEFSEETLWVSVTIFIVSIFWEIFKEKRYNLIVFIPSFFLVFKYSVARSDFYHFIHGFNFLVSISFIYLVKKNFSSTVLALLMLSMSFWRNAAHSLSYIPDPIVWPSIGLQGFSQSILRHNENAEKARKMLSQNLKNDQLPHDWIDLIGKETVDFFPWVTSSVALFSLNYKPRPFMQHGLSAHPFFDKINETYFLEKNPSQFIIWHGGWDSSGVTSMDNRHINFEHIRTLNALYTRYEQVDYRNGLALLRLKEKFDPDVRLENKIIPLGEYTLFLNEWFYLPKVDSTLYLFGKFHTKKYLLGYLRSILYKEPCYWIDVKFANSEIKQYRLALTGLQDLALLNPLILSNQITNRPMQVRAIRIWSPDSFLPVHKEIKVKIFNLKV